MEMCIYKVITEENINNLGFFLSGLGAIYFFFIYSLLTKTTINTDAFGKYMSHNISIKNFWLKNRADTSKDKYVESNERSSSNDIVKTDWSWRKKFAFWSTDWGATLSFSLVAVGFVLQLSSKFI